MNERKNKGKKEKRTSETILATNRTRRTRSYDGNSNNDCNKTIPPTIPVTTRRGTVTATAD